MTPSRTDLSTDTPALVARLRGLAEKATPGPWMNGDKAIDGSLAVRSERPVHGMTNVVCRPTMPKDAEFIVALVNAWPHLCDALTSLAPPPEAETKTCATCVHAGSATAGTRECYHPEWPTLGHEVMSVPEHFGCTLHQPSEATP